ncbi:SGNH/GDSL hydrolase family protein [Vibrio parahaemolyticus]|uniref:SGNH/GDSL hydrolase family protein n=3 Tax=Vibrionaceae TaxID=641 RepID=A0A7Y0SIB8_VIBPH|nr:SGNH/GDSL hydrolase family protein [Vibrio parahaemolyticus]MDF5045527.1 SGNH/GDSL hydrolase family protein [Vibrio parahaemolyticus]MDF5234431.1 SGNH/GDSL hydrolase family protein [Vibrio parahaemolyticus]MDF5243674.1 SGNH/GDSL hydrolase family protein [Vibrio parahaemolyticus]MDF5256950.1 SGNH/GDSL hydrolase family protein [Vibrio parahaemolyticus]MDF5276115.1 SGNH/GDSL hydrolase family protein [Vibrio parahaemolyticus]
MSSFPDLLTSFEEAVEALKIKLSQNESASGTYNGGPIQSIAKDVEDRFAALSALAQGRLTYKTKAEMDSAGAPPVEQLAEVWNDTTPEYNGLYGWDGAVWVIAPYSSTINKILKDNRTSPITGKAVWDIQTLRALGKNRFSKNDAERGYLPVLAPYDGVVIDVTNKAWTSGFIYVGDLSVGDKLYINGLVGDSYARAYTYYDKDKNVIDDSYQSLPANVTQGTVNGRKTQETVYFRITIVTTKETDTTDMNNVAVAAKEYLTEYESFFPVIHELFGARINASFVNDDPTEEKNAVNFGFVDKTYSRQDAFIGRNGDKNLLYLPDVVNGYLPVLAPFDGGLIESETYTATGFFSIDHLSVASDSLWFHKFKGSYSRYIYFYDENFQPVLDPNNAPHAYYKKFSVNEDGSPVEIANFRPSEGAVYARVTLNTESPTDDTDTNEVVINGNENYVYVKGEKTISKIMGRGVDATKCTQEPTSDDGVVNKAYGDRNYGKGSFGKVISPENMLYIPDVVSGYLSVSMPYDGKVQTDPNYQTSGFFSIEHFSLSDSFYVKGLSGGYGRYIYFYDKDFNPVLNPSDPSNAYYRKLPQDLVRDAWSVLANFRPSNDAVYARMTLTTGKSNDDTDLNDVIISNKQQDQYVAGYQLLKEISGFHIIAEKAMKEPKADFDIVNFKALKDWISSSGFNGRHLATLGDSITAGDSNWPKFASSILGMSHENFAVGGGHWEDFGAIVDDPRWFRIQVDNLLASSQAPDVIVIAMGTNSLFAPKGDFQTQMDAAFVDIDTTVVYGGMRHGLERIRAQYPTVPMFLTTPIQRVTSAPNSTEMINMVEAIKKIGEWYGCEVFNCHSDVQILHQIEKTTPTFLPDGLHPNDAGSEIQGCYIASKIKSSTAFYGD